MVTLFLIKQARIYSGDKTDSSKSGAGQGDQLVLCDHLEGWDGEGRREGDARGKRNGNILYMYN